MKRLRRRSSWGDVMTDQIDLETLVSYSDGQLSAKEVQRVEAALASNPEARETLRQLRESAALLRAAFNQPINEPVPARIVEAINSTGAKQAVVTRGSGRGALHRWFPALAASIAALLLGLGGSFFLTDYRVGQELSRIELVRLADKQAKEAALFKALEKNISGQVVAWENPDSGRSGSVTPVRTFKNRQGQWCREYAASEVQGLDRESRRAIACRQPEGIWKTRMVLFVGN